MYSLVLVSIYLVSMAPWLATDHTRHYTKAEVEYPLHHVYIVQLVARSTKQHLSDRSYIIQSVSKFLEKI